MSLTANKNPNIGSNSYDPFANIMGDTSQPKPQNDPFSSSSQPFGCASSNKNPNNPFDNMGTSNNNDPFASISPQP